jgi:hypothetical protein
LRDFIAAEKRALSSIFSVASNRKYFLERAETIWLIKYILAPQPFGRMTQIVASTGPVVEPFDGSDARHGWVLKITSEMGLACCRASMSPHLRKMTEIEFFLMPCQNMTKIAAKKNASA